MPDQVRLVVSGTLIPGEPSPPDGVTIHSRSTTMALSGGGQMLKLVLDFGPDLALNLVASYIYDVFARRKPSTPAEHEAQAPATEIKIYGDVYFVTSKEDVERVLRDLGRT